MTPLLSYLPTPDELSPAQMMAARAALSTWLAAYDPTLDTAPNSPFSDLYLNPAAGFIAAIEVAVARYLGDHDLQNIAAGGAYNCTVATNFVKNFNPMLTQAQAARGYIRLVFDTDAELEVPRSQLFQFAVTNSITANTTVSQFSPLLFSPGPAVIRKTGSIPNAADNSFVLRQINAREFCVDLPVTGTAAASIPPGTAATLSASIVNLVRAVASGVFTSGSDSVALTEQATMASQQIYASSLDTRFGALAFLRREFRDLDAAGVAISGDTVMTRDAVSPLGIAAPAMDIWVRGKSVRLLESATQRVPYYAFQEGVAVRKFITRLDLPGFPVLLESLTASGSPDILLNGVQIFSKSVAPERWPLMSAARSVDEELWLSIPMPTDGAGEDLIPLETAPDGTQYGLFDFNYRSDSSVPVISSCLRSDGVRPIRVKALVRGMVPVWIKQLTVRYRKSAGVLFKTAQAKEEIVRYINGVTYPEVISEARIADSVHYAGGSYVTTSCEADLELSMAGKVRSDSLDPETQWLAIEAAARTVPKFQALTLAQANFSVQDPQLGTEDALFYSAGPRNLMFFIDGDNITMEEVL